VNFALVTLIALIIMFLKKEGRFHLLRSLSWGGLDLISVIPGSKALRLRKIDWTGEYFEHKNEGIFFNFDPLLNPKNKDTVRDYNDVLNMTTHWEGSRRPVVFGSEAVSFITNPHISSALEEAKDHDDYDKVKPILENLKNVLGEEIVKVTFIKPFQPDNLREFLNSGSTPTKNQMLYEKGKLSGIFQMTRKRDLGKIVKFALPIGMLILILILWQSGAFDNIMSTFKS